MGSVNIEKNMILRRSPENVKAVLSIDVRNLITMTIINLINLVAVPTNDLKNLEFMQDIDLRNTASILLTGLAAWQLY